MSVDSSEQAAIVRDVENMRLQLRNANATIKTSVEQQTRNAIVQRINLVLKIAELGDDYAAAYGDGAGGTTAADVAAEIAQANTYVDAVIGVTDTTRAEIETEVAQ
jgi:hypothetical protein